MLPQVHIYTSHFFQRYNERFLHDDKLNDGFCFTRSAIECEKNVDPTEKVLAMGFIYTTFVNELNMTESQRAAINQEHAEELEKCFRELMNE